MSQPMDDAFLEKLDALLDGALSDTEAADLRERIANDPAWSAEYVRRRRIVDLVRGLPDESAPAGFSDALMERLPAARAKPAGGAPRGGVVRSMWMWGAGLAAAAALVLAVSLNRDDPSTEQDWTLAKQDADDGAAVKRHDARKDVDVLKEDGTFGAAIEKSTETALDQDKLKKTVPQPLAPKDEGEAKTLDPKSGTIAELDAEDVDESADAAMPGTATTAEPTRTRDRAVRRVTQELLLRTVEQRQTALTAAERAQYLDQVARVDDAALRAHLDRVVVMAADRTPPEAPKAEEVRRGATKAKAKAAPEPGAPFSSTAADQSRERTDAAEFDVAVAKRADAEALRKLLTRAFPPTRERAKKSTDPTALVSRSEVAADEADEARGQLRLEWTMSARDAEAMAVWLRRIGLRNLLDARIQTPQTIRRADEAKSRDRSGRTIEEAEAETRAAGAATVDKTIAVRVRIRFGPQSSTPERPKGDDK